MGMSNKALLSLVESAVNEVLAGGGEKPAEEVLEALGGSEEAITEPSKQKQPEPTTLSVLCRWCKNHLYTLQRDYMCKLLLSDAKLDPAELKATGRFGRNSSIQMDCPYCGEDVFKIRHYGGIEFLTKEEGMMPNAGTGPGIRNGAVHYFSGGVAKWA